jgi:predicted HTH domain antitoxin
MTTVTLNLPDDVYNTLRKTPRDFARELPLAAACHWYAQGQIAQDKAAEIAGLSRAEFIDELARRRIPVGQYSIEEVLEEIGRA